MPVAGEAREHRGAPGRAHHLFTGQQHDERHRAGDQAAGREAQLPSCVAGRRGCIASLGAVDLDEQHVSDVERAADQRQRAMHDQRGMCDGRRVPREERRPGSERHRPRQQGQAAEHDRRHVAEPADDEGEDSAHRPEEQRDHQHEGHPAEPA
ncbi:MAG: hypothetical protein IPK07_28170 [Deltaproteobacteria bacterium]|nr:hypothetical protein [Deltaproteobacteria bacterium]